jgi:hypothetical protein
MNRIQTSNLKTMVRGAYDIQKLRIQMGNRIVGNFKSKLGYENGEKEEETADAEGREIIDKLRVHYRKVADGVAAFPRAKDFKSDGVIDTYTELCLISEYVELEEQEQKHFRRLTTVLKEFPIYTGFLESVKGIGPAMAGVIVSEIDITRAKYPSSLWKYAGLDVAGDGAGRSRREEHLVQREYINSDGEKAMRNSITFNPFLKTKLVGVLAGSFLRAGAKDNPYRTYYDNYKHRIETDARHAEKSKLVWHRMAMRYMIKMFLLDLHCVWRRMEGLPVSVSYHQGKQGGHTERNVA